MDDYLTGLRIAFVTPTYGRSDLVLRTSLYVRSQRLSGAEARWFVFDDSPRPHAVLSGVFDDRVDYVWQEGKIPLGAKRNALNHRARAWGADFICAMDDDDWYGPDYGADLVTLLMRSPPQYDFSGSGDDYYYDIASGRILKVAAVRPFSTCNGVLAYRGSVLDCCRYDPSARSGEERFFLGKRPVLQHPDVKRIHLGLVHRHNTVTKRNYVSNPACRTDLTLLDFPMSDDDRSYYRGLTESSVKVAAAGLGAA